METQSRKKTLSMEILEKRVKLKKTMWEENEGEE